MAVADNFVNTGTASVTNGTKTVTFADVSMALIQPGDQFIQGGVSGIIYSVDSATPTAQLVENWPGTTSDADPYTVLTIPDDTAMASKVRTILDNLAGPILTIAAMSGDDVPSNNEMLYWSDGDWAKDTLANLIAATDDLTLAGHPTIEGVTSTGATGTGKMVFASEPVLEGDAQVDGRLGVGVDPAYTLHVKGSGDTIATINAPAGSNPAIRINRDGDANDVGLLSCPNWLHGSGSTEDLELSPGSGNLVLNAPSGKEIQLSNNTSVSVRLTSSGQLLSGVTSSWNSISTKAEFKGGIAISGWCTASGDVAVQSRVDNVGGFLMACFYGTDLKGSITTDGTSTAYNTSSDVRLKENIADANLVEAWAVVNALRVRSWTWKGVGVFEPYGLIAQEEILAAPFAVTRGDDDPDVISKQWQRDDSKLVPALLLVIQDLGARVEALEQASS